MQRTSSKLMIDYKKEELGAIYKPWKNRIRIALVYPNTYFIGMSNLGFQTVYAKLNEFDHIVCERFFLPDVHTSSNISLKSIESQRLLTEFDLIAFSISFENDYLHILQILSIAKIPLLSAERSTKFPLIMAGGIATFLNPEPLADFMDFFLIGEAELVLDDFISFFSIRLEKTDLLKELSMNIKGIYVPSFYKPIENDRDELVGYQPLIKKIPPTIERIIASDPQRPATTKILTPNTLFANTFLIEVGKGCPHGCRFCSAGFVYRPPRFHAAEVLEKIFDEGASKTDHIGFVGAAISDCPNILSLLKKKKEGKRVSFSSLRADNLQPMFIEALVKSHVKSVAIAPDAGSERLRHAINKNISENDFLLAVEKLVENGILNIKVYFMIGLPMETWEDIEAIILLIKKLKEVFLKTSRLRGKIGKIIVTISSFVPKPWTPFQWCAMNTEKKLKEKLKYIREILQTLPNIQIHADSISNSTLQGILARGNRRTSAILHSLQEKRPVSSILKQYFLEENWLYHEFPQNTFFPWDILSAGVSKSFLWQEYQLSLSGQNSAPCSMSKNCKRCGACLAL